MGAGFFSRKVVPPQKAWAGRGGVENVLPEPEPMEGGLVLGWAAYSTPHPAVKALEPKNGILFSREICLGPQAPGPKTDTPFPRAPRPPGGQRGDPPRC